MYEKVRALAQAGEEHALVALLRFRRVEDLPLVQRALEAPLKTEWNRVCAALRAVTTTPDPRLFAAVAARKVDFRDLRGRNPHLYHGALRAYGTEEAKAILRELGVPAETED